LSGTYKTLIQSINQWGYQCRSYLLFT